MNRLKKISNVSSLQILAYTLFFVSGMTSTLLGVLLPDVRNDYHFSYFVSGSVLSAHQIGNLAGGFIAGLLPLFLGRKKSTLFLCFGIVIGLLLITITGNPLLLFIAFLATGLGRGSSSNICNVIASEQSSNKTVALNILHATFAVGALLSPLLVILLTAKFHINWRVTAWIVAVMEAAALLMLSKSGLSNVPARKGGKADRGFLRSGSFWLITAILFSYLCCESCIVGWLVTYFKDSGMMGATLAASTSSIVWIMMLAGRLFCAGISNKANKNKMLIVMAVAQLVFFTVMVLAHNIVVLMVGLIGLGLSMSGFYPTTFSTMDANYISSTVAVGTCTSISNIGAIIMPLVVGIVAEHTTITAGFSVIGIALVTMLVLTLIKKAAASKNINIIQED